MFEIEEAAPDGRYPLPDEGRRETARGLDDIVDNLCGLLAREQAELRAGRYELLAGFAAEKHHLLVQLDRQMRATGEHGAAAGAGRARVDRLRRSLEDNMRLLKFRIDAINELADTIEQARRIAESDGTYDGGFGGGREAWS